MFHFLNKHGKFRLLFCVLTLAFVFSACGKLSDIPQFPRSKAAIAAAISALQTGWLSSTTIDAGNFHANNDSTATCTAQFGGGEGCMISPPVLYSDNRFFAAFTQNYIETGGQVKFTLFASLTNLTTGIFGSLGSGLGLIDSGLGLDGNATESSSRYVRLAKLSNGDVVAVYMVEEPGTVRTIFATVYSSSTKTWGTAFQLGTSNLDTDRGADYYSTNDTAGTLYVNNFCRPSVAASGTKALVAWCEDISAVATDPASVVKHAIYNNGVWSIAAGTPTSLITEGASVYAYPGFSGAVSSFENVALHDCDLLVDSDGDGTLTNDNDDYICPDEIYDLRLSRSTTTASIDIATTMAVGSFAGPGEFNIVYNTSLKVQMCETMQNLFNSILSSQTSYDPGAGSLLSTGYNLSQRGVSIELNPLCDNNDSSTWFGIAYYNKALKSYYRNLTSTNNVVSQIRSVASDTTSPYGPAVTYDLDYSSIQANAVPSQLLSTSGNEVEWWNHSRTSWVDVAGDGYGNFILVRSGVAPVFQTAMIDPSVGGSGDLVGLKKGRMLFGHEYSASSGWKTDATTTSELKSAQVSNTPSCNNQSDNFVCSVKNPKTLMSEGGHGLVLYYQEQPDSFQLCSGSTDCNKNPNRLWYSTYSTTSGYSQNPQILDQDVVCNSSSIANDAPVCEAGTFSFPCAFVSQEGTLGAANALTVKTQVFDSPSDTTTSSLDGDITAVPAAMNKNGKAIVAYHKPISTGSSASPSCSLNTSNEYYVGLYVHRYDPVTGFASAERIDDGLGYTMHASVAVSDNGKMAVVWEELYDTGSVYVYLRTYDSASASAVWTTAKQINSSQTTVSTPMMPSVGINNNGDIVVTYSYQSSGAVKRRQYVRQYRSL